MNKVEILQMLWSIIVLSDETEIYQDGIRTTLIDKNSLLNTISNEIMSGEDEDEDLCS
jgi:hypothetical protein